MTNLFLENNKTKIEFAIEKEQITIRKVCFFGEEYVNFPAGMQHSYVFIVGQAYRRKIVNRYGVGGEILRYKSHRFLQGENKKQLIVEEENERVVVITTYTLYENNATIECKKEVRNVSGQPFTLECVSPLTLKGVFLQGEVIQAEEPETVEDPTTRFDAAHAEGENDDLPYLWRMNSSWCSEGNFERLDLAKEGLRTKAWRNRYNKILVHNNGTMTTNRFFPFGMLEKEKFGYLAFELLPTGSWSYEIETGIYDWDSQALMVCLTGKTLGDNGWSKILSNGEIYETETVRVVGAPEVETIVENLLGTRRIAHRKHTLAPYADVVYNGFMFNNWDCPTEEKDEKNIPVVAERGADYYVIDAGWHDRGEDVSPTIEAGEWRENVLRYPSGLQKTIERVRAKGMKFGFWVELQGIGIHCPNKNILPEHCFFHVDGVRTVCNNRWQLDYSQNETREWATATISRLITEYNPDYIKIDYNQIQTANECKTGSLTEGVCAHSRAYLEWYKKLQDAYPQVLFETCSSGGMLMDANHASLATVFSVSDCNDCYAYPTMLGNLSALLMPEQMGAWCMPVPLYSYPNTTDERVIINVINSLYFCMHLSTKMDCLTEQQKTLLDEGIAYYKQLAAVKTKALPVFPKGLLAFDDETPVFGLKADGKLYLAVYNVSTKVREITLDLRKYNVKSCTLAYPKAAKTAYGLDGNVFKCELQGKTARAFEFIIET